MSLYSNDSMPSIPLPGDSAQCLGKQKFTTLAEAQRAANAINRRKRRGRNKTHVREGAVEVYACRCCDHYHIGGREYGRGNRGTTIKRI